MAAARKCDRCGEFYEESVAHDITMKCYTHGHGFYDIDLCPECHKGLVDYLYGSITLPENGFFAMRNKEDLYL